MRKEAVKDTTIFGLKLPLTKKTGNWLTGGGKGFNMGHVKLQMFTRHPDGAVK